MVLAATLLINDLDSQPATKANPTVPPMQLVSTATPSQRMLRATATVSGVWVAREEVTIGSPLEGLRVVEVLVESGEQVSAGQLLVRLERTVLESQARQAEHAVRRARAEYTQASEQYQRVQRLLPPGAISRQDFEAVRASALATKAALQQAEAAWDEQRARQEQTEVRAPFSGIITQRNIQIGATVGAHSTLFRLASDQPLEFLAQVPQQLLPELVVGMEAQVHTSGRQGLQSGSVRLLSTGVDLSTGYGHSRIAMTEQPSPFIRPGSVGSARIILAQRDVLAVDIRALRYANQPGREQEPVQPFVFVVDANRVARTPVQLGIREGGWVEVRAGLSPSSRVVIAGASLLQHGDVVHLHEVDTETGTERVQRKELTRRPAKAGLKPWKYPLIVRAGI